MRTVLIDGEPWFVGSDIQKALGLRNISAMMRPVSDADKRKMSREKLNHGTLQTLKGAPTTAGVDVHILSEKGLYQVILRAQSTKPEARASQDWVTGTVLPAIRKDGSYIDGEEKVSTGEMTEDELVLKAMRNTYRVGSNVHDLKQWRME